MIWFTIITKLIDFLIIIVIVLISLAYLTLIERKVMGIMQRRKGPNVVGILGLLQPFNVSGISYLLWKIRLYAEIFISYYLFFL